MQQKIITCFKEICILQKSDYDWAKELEEVVKDGWLIKQISSSGAINDRRSSLISVTLLLEKD